MNNFKLTIQYDGTNYAGWQIQKNADTIQQEISRCINILTKEEITLNGAGRTDAGVHAAGQVANFKTNARIEIPKFLHSLNSMLPPAISVSKIETADENFHARFSAKSRSYFYIFNSIKSPFYNKYSYFYQQSAKFDTAELNRVAALLSGNHDFTSFSKKGSETSTNLCEIMNARWHRRKSFLVFYIEANRFLRGMVRAIVGTQLEIIENKNSIADIGDILNQKNRDAAGRSVPAHGLILHNVRY